MKFIRVGNKYVNVVDIIMFTVHKAGIWVRIKGERGWTLIESFLDDNEAKTALNELIDSINGEDA